jgi:hypothetical protein
MLTFERPMSAKDKDKHLLFHKLIPAVYYAYAAGDQCEEKTNTIKYVDDSNVEKTSVKTYTQPVMSDDNGAAVVSKTAANDLFTVAIADMTTRYPGVDPLWTLLLKASEGVNADIKAENTPKKEKTPEQAVNELAEALALLPRYKGKDKAVILAAAKKMYAESEAEEAAA